MVVGCTRSYKLILLIALIAICSYFPVPVLSKAATKASKAQASSKSKGNDASSSNSISTVAIPRGKQTKNPWYRILNRGIVQGIAREIKSSFSSDLEALTLQVLLSNRNYKWKNILWTSFFHASTDSDAH